MSGSDAFGYREQPVQAVASLRVAEAKQADTLQPGVVVMIRTDLLGEQHTYGLSLEAAEGLRDELDRWIQRARERHWGT